ncbi:MAG: hypothetical protein M5U34_27990 [Chloroflexi bacterium]|nr:hypothetical protein [Chloroflexota bacterium]
MRIDTQLAADIQQAIKEAQTAVLLPAFEIPEIIVEKPRDPAHGDYATPTSLRLAKLARMAPIKIAQIIADQMKDLDYLDDIDVAPPGFINFRLSLSYLQGTVERILNEGMDFGRIDIGAGKKRRLNASAPTLPAPSP